MFVRAKEHLEVGNESGSKLFQGDVLHLVADGEEFLQVLINDLVLQKRAFGFHTCLHLLDIVLVVLLEQLASAYGSGVSVRERRFLLFLP